MQTAGGIEDDDIVAVVFGVFDGFFRDGDGVFGAHLKDRYLRFRADDLELFDRGGSIDIAGDQHGSVVLFFEVLTELGGMSGFTGTLQAAQHDDGRRLRGILQTRVLSAHQVDELFVDDFDDHLSGSQALHDVGADRALGDGVGKALGDLEVNVGFEQRETHLTHRFLDVGFCQLALAFELFKGVIQFIG